LANDFTNTIPPRLFLDIRRHLGWLLRVEDESFGARKAGAGPAADVAIILSQPDGEFASRRDGEPTQQAERHDMLLRESNIKLSMTMFG
jgi:hypothetical protein